MYTGYTHGIEDGKLICFSLADCPLGLLSNIPWQFFVAFFHRWQIVMHYCRVYIIWSSSKHLKGQLGTPVSNITFLINGGKLGSPMSNVTFLNQMRFSSGPNLSLALEARSQTLGNLQMFPPEMYPILYLKMYLIFQCTRQKQRRHP